KYLEECDKGISMPDGMLCYSLTSQFRYYNQVWIDLRVPEKMKAGSSSTVEISVGTHRFESDQYYLPKVDSFSMHQPEIIISWIQSKEVLRLEHTRYTLSDRHDSVPLKYTITAPQKPGTYYISAGI